MKTIKSILIFLAPLLLVSAAVFGQTAQGSRGSDWESVDVVYRLLSIKEPGAPVIQGNSVIFTADSAHRRVGVAFAHEDFSNVHWFTKLLVPQDRLSPVLLPGQRVPDATRDSGIQFYVYEFPEQVNGRPLNELKYRLVINGLWTTDPANSQIERDAVSGLNVSVINLPQRQGNLHPVRSDRGVEGLHFTYTGEPGEIVTVAGSFNAWDPFMFELKEGPAGTYTLTLPLPPGTYQYVFYNRGRRYTDQNNPRRAYARDGTAVSEAVIP